MSRINGSIIGRARKFCVAALAVSVLAGSSFAFEYTGFGLRGGINTGSLQVFTYTDDDGDVRGTWNNGRGFNMSGGGFHFGASADFFLSEVELDIAYNLGFNPGMYFASKGGSRRISVDRYYGYTYTVDAYFVDLAAPFSLTRPQGRYDIRFELGPYLGIGLFGKQRITGGPQADGYPKSNTFNDVDRFDFGLFYAVVFEYASNYFISVRGGEGFVDSKIRSWYLTLGYNFKN
jgi:hypothetical protein